MLLVEIGDTVKFNLVKKWFNQKLVRISANLCRGRMNTFLCSVSSSKVVMGPPSAYAASAQAAQECNLSINIADMPRSRVRERSYQLEKNAIYRVKSFSNHIITIAIIKVFTGSLNKAMLVFFKLPKIKRYTYILESLEN